MLFSLILGKLSPAARSCQKSRNSGTMRDASENISVRLAISLPSAWSSPSAVAHPVNRRFIRICNVIGFASQQTFFFGRHLYIAIMNSRFNAASNHLQWSGKDE
jgi:hypothetical protein